MNQQERAAAARAKPWSKYAGFDMIQEAPHFESEERMLAVFRHCLAKLLKPQCWIVRWAKHGRRMKLEIEHNKTKGLKFLEHLKGRDPVTGQEIELIKLVKRYQLELAYADETDCPLKSWGVELADYRVESYVPSEEHAELLAHVEQNLRVNWCAGSEEKYQEVRGWLRQLVREPHSKLDKMLVIRGDCMGMLGFLEERVNRRVINPQWVTTNKAAVYNNLIEGAGLAVQRFGAPVLTGESKGRANIVRLATSATHRVRTKGIGEEYRVPNQLALILGNERGGQIMPALADMIVEVPFRQPTTEAEQASENATSEASRSDAQSRAVLEWLAN